MIQGRQAGGGLASPPANAPHKDDVVIAVDDLDPTKKIKFELAGIASGQTKIITINDDVTLPSALITHALGGSGHSADSLANLNSKITDATLIDTGDSRLSDARTPTGAAGGDLGGTYPNPTVNAHAFAGAKHTADTIANLKTKISDGSLITTAAAEINAITEKTAPVGNDVLLLEDSEAANVKKRVKVGNLSLTVEDLETNIDFAAEATKDFEFTFSKRNGIILRARIFVRDSVTTPFSDVATISLYAASTRTAPDLIARFRARLVHTTLSALTPGGSPNFSVTDNSDLNVDDIIIFQPATAAELHIIKTIGSPNVADRNISAFANGTGVVRVPMLDLNTYFGDASKKIYGRMTFAGNVTINTKMQLKALN